MKRKVGRPKKKEESINKKLLKELYLLGKTDAQVAELIGVNVLTIHRWKKKFPNLCKTLKDWKQEADEKVEKSLYQRALGYEVEEITQEPRISLDKDNGKERVLVITKIVKKQVAASEVACIFWLKNRQPDKWRETKEFTIPDADKYFKAIADALAQSDTDTDSVL
uniref:Putative terminase n=1 Tax=viral metagenome TaxID=1070528 RepID=A0A6H1ZEU7_9ZZZZ